MIPLSRRQFLAAAVAATLATPQSLAAHRKWRVAIVGHTGQGGYGHGLDTMWLKTPEAEIVGVADPDAKGLTSALQRLRAPRGFADFREMFSEVKPDLVAIGPREITHHRDYALAAIKAGARGIYMEKPFCRTLAEADEIAAACASTGAKLALAHRNRYHPALPAALAAVQDGRIGRLLEIRGRGKEDARGGTLDLWILGTHVLNIAVQFSGAPTAVSASLLQDGRTVTRSDLREGAEGVGPLAGNEVHARFETEHGVPVFFDSTAKAGNPRAGFGVQLIGTLGVIDFRMDTTPFAHLIEGSPFQPAAEPRSWIPISSAGVGAAEPLENVKDAVMQHLLPARDLMSAIEENREPLCGVHAARQLVEMITGVFESARLGSQRVTFPLTRTDNPLTGL